MKLSELTRIQLQHLAWRLDNKTACDYLTACKIARKEFGNLNLVKIFIRFGNCTLHSAKIHASKVINLKVKE